MLTDEDQVSGREAIPRRSFITASAMMLAALTGCAQADIPSTEPSYKASRRLPSKVAIPSDVGTPTYLPTGYRLTGAYKGMPSGFRGGPDELALIYRSPLYEDEKARPLVIFFARNNTNEFGLTQGRAGEPLALGEAVTNALYFDGAWSPSDGAQPEIMRRGHGFRWDRTRLHAAVGEWRGFRIGIRGDKTKGVSRSDLVQMLASMPSV